MKTKLFAILLAVAPLAHADVVGIRPPWEATKFYVFQNCTVLLQKSPATVDCDPSSFIFNNPVPIQNGPSGSLILNGSPAFDATLNAKGTFANGEHYYLISIP